MARTISPQMLNEQAVRALMGARSAGGQLPALFLCLAWLVAKMELLFG